MSCPKGSKTGDASQCQKQNKNSSLGDLMQKKQKNRKATSMHPRSTATKSAAFPTLMISSFISHSLLTSQQFTSPTVGPCTIKSKNVYRICTHRRAVHTKYLDIAYVCCNAQYWSHGSLHVIQKGAKKYMLRKLPTPNPNSTFLKV